jgi:tyrosine-protein kinase Etk/Wzc
MVTSSMGNEGKSFISLNLANVLALANNRVLLVELDLRKPKILKYLNISSKQGLANYLISDISIEKIIIPSGINENLFLACSGTIPPNPTELLLRPRLADFFATVKKQFDYIIIDSPPVGLVTDGQIISKYVDATLFIIRQKYTLKNQLIIIQDIYENKKINNLCILVNDVKEKSGYGYGYTLGYGYGYGNGNGYFEKAGKNKKYSFNKIFK